MRKGNFAILFAVVLAFSANIAFAAPSNLYWHSNDYYSIEMSGSGNAFVVGTIQLEALSTQPVNTITLEIPYTGVTFYKIVENGIYQSVCIQPSGILCPINQPCYPCNGYQQVYQPSAFLNYTTQTLSDSTIITINLAYPVQNDTSTTLNLIFSTTNIAQKTFQGFQFNFKTVEDPNALIRSLSADVSVPQNMYLKGKPSFNIQYRPSEIAAQALKATNAEAFVQSYPIRYGGGQFTASNLQPGESFTISGLYGDNLVLLYADYIAIAVLGIVVLAILVKYYFADRVTRMFARREGDERMSRRASEFSFGRPVLVGFVSSFIFIAVYYLLNLVFSNGYYYGDAITSIMFLVINAIFILLSLFGFPYYLYSRFNKSEGILAGIVSLILSFVLLILLLPQYSPPAIYAGIQSLGIASSGSGTVTAVPAS